MSLDLPLNYANEKLPPVSKDLIVWLRQVFPDRMPDHTESLDDIRFKQGQVSVIRTLISIEEEQNDVLRQ